MDMLARLWCIGDGDRAADGSCWTQLLGNGVGQHKQDEKTNQKKKKGESEAERKAVPSIGERGRKKLLSFAPH